MDPAPRSDGATDLTIGLLLAVGTACWVGLVAGQLGRFHLVPVLVAGAGAAAVAVYGLRGVASADEDRAAVRWRALDGPLVLLLAALLYVPGYDTALSGSDATVYFGTAAHLARTGALAIDEPLLRQVPAYLQDYAFPSMLRNSSGPAARSLSGLVFDDVASPIYSTFSQLPSVWTAIGFASAGVAGGRSAGPLLAAAALMAFYLLVRRASGTGTAVAAAALLTTALPQLLFARLPMGESGAQFFLWGGLLAYDRFRERGGTLLAVAAGAGFGLAGLARPEYIAFVPLGALLLRVLPGERQPFVPVAIVTALLFLHAIVLVLFVVPSHYRHALHDALQTNGLLLAPPLTVGSVSLVAAVAVAVATALAQVGGGSGLRARRAVGLALLALWTIGYVSMGASPAQGHALRWLPQYASWPVLGLAVVGFPLLVRRWWGSPGARLASMIGCVAAAHFLYDVHTAPLPAWAARRFVPAALPLLVAAAAIAIGVLGRSRALAGAIALIAVSANLYTSRPLLGTPYFEGGSAAVSEVARLTPEGSVVLLDGSLQPTLLDVPLLLIHGRDAIQSPIMSGPIDHYAFAFAYEMPGVPVYLLRAATYLPPPPLGERVRFEPSGEVRRKLLFLGDDPDAPTDFYVRAYRVVIEPG